MFRVRLITLMLGLVVAVAVQGAVQAQGKNGDRQFYSAWRAHGDSGNQYIREYFYKVRPADTRYHFQYVVWVRSQPKLAYFYNAKGEYWCAAPKDVENKWHVLKANVGLIRDVVLPEVEEAPLIPQTKGTGFEEKMLFPNFDGLPKG